MWTDSGPLVIFVQSFVFLCCHCGAVLWEFLNLPGSGSLICEMRAIMPRSWELVKNNSMCELSRLGYIQGMRISFSSLICPFSTYLFICSLSRQLPSAGCVVGTVLGKVCFSPHSFSSSCWEESKLDVRTKALGTKDPESRRKAIPPSHLFFWHLGGLLFVRRLETGGLWGNGPLTSAVLCVTAIHVTDAGHFQPRGQFFWAAVFQVAWQLDPEWISILDEERWDIRRAPDYLLLWDLKQVSVGAIEHGIINSFLSELSIQSTFKIMWLIEYKD